MENTPEEFEAKPSSNKDMWLFLIVLDVVFLCVLGFFLYKHFAGTFVNPPAQPAAPVAQLPAPQPPQVEEVDEVVVIGEVIAPQPAEAAAAAPQPVKEVTVAAVTEEPAQPQAPAPEVKTDKQSVVVTANSSKYRRVTFRWFEPAKSVAIVSGFTNRKPQALKKVGDYWETTLSIAPGTYKFLYVVDGKNTLDPYSEQKDGRSVLVVK